MIQPYISRGVLLLAGCVSGVWAETRIDLHFERLPQSGLDPIQINLYVSDNNQPVTGIAAELSVDISQGQLSPMLDRGDGFYQTTLTPDQESEYQVQAHYGAIHSQRHRLLVIDTVHDRWGQPQSVMGLVNTPGYEDGATVSADGDYLFVQYGPIHFTALLTFYMPRSQGGCAGERLRTVNGTTERCTHSWYDDLIGPVSAPERPGFFDGRFADGRWLHNAASWGLDVEQSPIFAPSTLFYGFKRQSNDHYSEPFRLGFYDANDGIINAFGFSVVRQSNGLATIAYTLDDPSDAASVDLDGDGEYDIQSYFDVYSMTTELGADVVLGEFVPSGTPGTPPVRNNTEFPSQKVSFADIGIDGLAGTQGNPHLQANANGDIIAILTDDEYDQGGDRDDLSVYVLTDGAFPNGDWQKIELPRPVNRPRSKRDYQPFFVGQSLYYTQSDDNTNPIIVRSEFSGEMTADDLARKRNWSKPDVQLASRQQLEVGSIIAIGEPSVASIDGVETLFFIYGIIRGYDDEMILPDIDMQVGFVPQRAEP